MALRDWITNYLPVATATVATLATLGAKEQRNVAEVATVAVANVEKKGIYPLQLEQQLGEIIPENAAVIGVQPNTPAICMNCERLEIVAIMGKHVPGCLYTTPGEYPDGWRRLPGSLKKCMWARRRPKRQVSNRVIERFSRQSDQLNKNSGGSMENQLEGISPPFLEVELQKNQNTNMSL